MSDLEVVCNEGLVDVHSDATAEDTLELCITHESDFIDYQFLPNKASIIHPDAPLGASETIPSTWERLKRISPAGVVFSAALSSDSIIRGCLGDFGFMGAVAILSNPIDTINPDSFLLKKLLAPPLSDDVLAKELACGMFTSHYYLKDFIYVFPLDYL